MKAPKEVLNLMDIFKSNGYESYLVGGCVRDMLLEREPKDYDLCTNALPEQTLNICKGKFKVIETGLKHGTVTILVNKMPIEVTTFRSDSNNLSCNFSNEFRETNNMKYTNSLMEDLSKRDFTINAIAWCQAIAGTIDYFNGIDDITNKIVRCVGDSDERFQEDPLRMMRAIRFSAQLGFKIEDNTKQSIHRNSHLLKNVSIERITSEFNKILSSNPLKISDLNNFRLLDHFIPEYDICELTDQNNPYHTHNVGDHLLHSTCNIENKLHLRLTMFFHDICKPECKTTDENNISHFYRHTEKSADKAYEILKRMKYDNDTIDRVVTLIKYHDIEIAGKKTIRKMLNKIGEENFRDLLKVKEADSLAQNPIYYSQKHSKLIANKQKLEEVIEEKNCFSLKDLKITGYDIMQLGYKNREIGIILNKLLDVVLEEPKYNDKEYLLSLAKKMNIYNELGDKL
jgi:tRNA nucleotidyltransferase (CCA-adding enzyme)